MENNCAAFKCPKMESVQLNNFQVTNPNKDINPIDYFPWNFIFYHGKDKRYIKLNLRTGLTLKLRKKLNPVHTDALEKVMNPFLPSLNSITKLFYCVKLSIMGVLLTSQSWKKHTYRQWLVLYKLLKKYEQKLLPSVVKIGRNFPRINYKAA